MSEKPPATVEDSLQEITTVRKPILPRISVERLADLPPSAVVVVGAVVLVVKVFGGGMPSYLLR